MKPLPNSEELLQATKTNYYCKEIAPILEGMKEVRRYSAKIQLFSPGGNATKHMDINNDSLDALEEFIKEARAILSNP